MRVVKTVFVMTILLFVLKMDVRAQVFTKAKFKRIELATYDLNSPRTRQTDKVELLNYTTIDEYGLVEIVNTGYAGTKYYRFQLTTSMIDSLNDIFNGEKQLDKFLLKRKQDEGHHFAGYYKYVRYNFTNNRNDALCFIEPFMSEYFNNVYDRLKNIIYRQPNKEVFMQCWRKNKHRNAFQLQFIFNEL
jgi:hypothetical protein